ncbi:MAG: CDP-glycerol glycerophosphotransferase family protein [Leucobacter sp.]
MTAPSNGSSRSPGGGFSFAEGNLAKLLAAPKYLLSMLLAVFVPRRPDRWVFGSGIGVGEGALALARELRDAEPGCRIAWTVADEAEAEQARAEGFEAVLRRSRAGYWTTLRARYAVVTHGLGDVNRFGVPGARIVHLGHGAPVKKLHLDSPVTTAVRGPAPLQALLRRMYLSGTRRVWLYVAGSDAAAERLRSAYRVQPGRVLVLGDPRDDALALSARSAEAGSRSRAAIGELLGLDPAGEGSGRLILYAPTWRDGAPDPAAPVAEEAEAIRALMSRLDAHLVIRSHPLGTGAYEAALGERVHLLGPDLLRDITPHLAAFDAVITDYSSIALDFALTGRPIVWFAPDLAAYTATRGLYEPLEVTAASRVQHDWGSALGRLEQVLSDGDPRRVAAQAETRALKGRFYAYPEGGAAARVLAEIRRLDRPDRELIPGDAVFFESFYGRQVGCNPLAIDREIAARRPGTPRYWSVLSERVEVPEGAAAVLVGGHEWFAARRRARLLVVNDWLRHGFRRRSGQTVLQTWHGTMLKHLALGRPDVGLRTRLAILRESRRWSLLLSQNPHSTEQFRSSYAFRGEIVESGYPRDDRLARAIAPEAGAVQRNDRSLDGPTRHERIPFVVEAARRAVGVPAGARVVAYAPTWRDGIAAGSGTAGGAARGTAAGVVDLLDVHALAVELNDGPGEWVVVARGHTRTHEFGGYSGPGPVGADGSRIRVIDASHHPDVNDVILAADLLVTDYSSLMFDAPVARVPLAFFVPDLEAYRDRERGFSFDFEATAPGPLLTSREQVVACARALAEDGADAEWIRVSAPAYAAWRERFAPHDDGRAAVRVVDLLEERGALGL